MFGCVPLMLVAFLSDLKYKNQGSLELLVRLSSFRPTGLSFFKLQCAATGFMQCFHVVLHCGSSSVTRLTKRAFSECLELKLPDCFSLAALAFLSLQVPTLYNSLKSHLFVFAIEILSKILRKRHEKCFSNVLQSAVGSY